MAVGAAYHLYSESDLLFSLQTERCRPDGKHHPHPREGLVLHLTDKGQNNCDYAQSHWAQFLEAQVNKDIVAGYKGCHIM